MKRSRILIIMLGLTMASVNLSCKKYLDAKSDQKLALISQLSDLQGLFNADYVVDQNDPATGEAVSDNFYLTNADYLALPDYQKNRYTWAGHDEFFLSYSNQWGQCYKCIYEANIALANINKIPKTTLNAQDWNSLKGQAYFLRAHNFLMAVSLWSLAYDPQSASTDLGVPLRLDPDINKPSKRATVQQTYDQIIDDLKKAIPLLPINPINLYRGSRPAAYGLLARAYLFMREYDSCYRYADLALQLRSKLLDYNLLPQDAPYPFADFTFEANPEIIIAKIASVESILGDGKVDTILYRSYDDDDLRKWCYFNDNGDGSHSYKGSYSGAFDMWNGIATDELYLMRAECYARQGKKNLALQDLNTLLIKRWRQGTFRPFTAVTADGALNIILQERRKELIMRNVRWMDIKRLNKEGANITLKRIADGKTYILPSNDLRFALTIPEDIVGPYDIQQNPR